MASTHPPQAPPARRPAWHILLPTGLAEAALLAALVWSPLASAPWVPLLLFGGAVGAYVAAAFRLKDAPGGGRIIWGVAIAMRLVLLPAPPELSQEVHRYLWDGALQAAGTNPFGPEAVAPGAEAQPAAGTAGMPRPSSPTPHPPLAQLAFLAVALAGGAVAQAKLLWIGLDLATAWILGRVAYRTGRSRRLTHLLYLWSPLLLVEVAWSGNAVPLALFTLSLVVLLARAPLASGVCAGLAALAAPPALAGIPAAGRRLGARFVVGALAAMAVLTLPYLSRWRDVLVGLVPWARTEGGMAGPHLLLASVVPEGPAARWVALTLLLAVALWVGARRLRPERALLWVLGAALLLGPEFHPADALLILPFAALRLSLPWLLFTAVAFLGHAGAGGTMPGVAAGPPLWAHLAVWLPPGAFLAREGMELWSRSVPLAHVGAPRDVHRPLE